MKKQRRDSRSPRGRGPLSIMCNIKTCPKSLPSASGYFMISPPLSILWIHYYMVAKLGKHTPNREVISRCMLCAGITRDLWRKFSLLVYVSMACVIYMTESIIYNWNQKNSISKCRWYCRSQLSSARSYCIYRWRFGIRNSIWIYMYYRYRYI